MEAILAAEPEDASLTVQEPEPVTTPQQRFFTIDMSVEPPPIPLLFDAEAASKKRQDDGDFDEIQITIDDPQLACPADATESSEVGQSSVAIVDSAQGGLPSSESEIAMFVDSDEKEHKSNTAGTPNKKGPSSVASSTSSEKTKNLKKEKEKADLLHNEEAGRWFADPRLRKRLAEQLAHRSITSLPTGVATAVENPDVNVIQQNVEVETPTPIASEDMADISQQEQAQHMNNTITSPKTSELSQNGTEMSNSHTTELMNGGMETIGSTAAPSAYVNGFTLDTHRFGHEVDATDEDMSDSSRRSRVQRNRELMLRRRRGNNLPDPANDLAVGALPEVMDIVEEYELDAQREFDEFKAVVEQIKFIPPLRIVPHARQRNPGGKQSAVQILKELGKEYNIKPIYTFDGVPTSEDADGPMDFKVTVFAGLRDGTGIGATRKEAMNEAAEKCIRSLKLFNPSLEVNMDFKKITKTEAAKDILYVLSRVCKEFNLADPEYECLVDDFGWVTFTCYVGDYVMEGRAKKKRTSQRKAAFNMYEFIREVYNFERMDELAV